MLQLSLREVLLSSTLEDTRCYQGIKKQNNTEEIPQSTAQTKDLPCGLNLLVNVIPTMLKVKRLGGGVIGAKTKFAEPESGLQLGLLLTLGPWVDHSCRTAAANVL